MGFVLLVLIAFAVISTLKYYGGTDATKSTPARVFEAVKMGGLAAAAAVAGKFSSMVGQ